MAEATARRSASATLTYPGARISLDTGSSFPVVTQRGDFFDSDIVVVSPAFSTSDTGGVLLVAVSGWDGTVVQPATCYWSDAAGNAVSAPAGATNWAQSLHTEWTEPSLAGKGSSQIWTAWVSPGFTLTGVRVTNARAIGAGHSASQLAVYALRGASPVLGATAAKEDATGTAGALNVSITPQKSGSWVLGSVMTGGTSGALTAQAGTTIDIQFNSAALGDSFAAFHRERVPTSSITVGCSDSFGYLTVAAVEIQARSDRRSATASPQNVAPARRSGSGSLQGTSISRRGATTLPRATGSGRRSGAPGVLQASGTAQRAATAAPKASATKRRASVAALQATASGRRSATTSPVAVPAGTARRSGTATLWRTSIARRSGTAWPELPREGSVFGFRLGDTLGDSPPTSVRRAGTADLLAFAAARRSASAALQDHAAALRSATAGLVRTTSSRRSATAELLLHHIVTARRAGTSTLRAAAVPEGSLLGFELAGVFGQALDNVSRRSASALLQAVALARRSGSTLLQAQAFARRSGSALFASVVTERRSGSAVLMSRVISGATIFVSPSTVMINQPFQVSLTYFNASHRVERVDDVLPFAIPSTATFGEVRHPSITGYGYAPMGTEGAVPVRSGQSITFSWSGVAFLPGVYQISAAIVLKQGTYVYPAIPAVITVIGV